MDPSEKVYFGDKKVRIFWLALLVAMLIIAFSQREILEMLGKAPCVRIDITLLLGAFSALFYVALDRTLFRPKMRICDHFLIFSYDQDVISWSQVTSVRVKKNALILQVPKAKFRGTYHISLSFISHKEEIVEDIRKICEAKGIPFGEMPQHEVQGERIKFIQWRR